MAMSFAETTLQSIIILNASNTQILATYYDST